MNLRRPISDAEWLAIAVSFTFAAPACTFREGALLAAFSAHEECAHAPLAHSAHWSTCLTHTRIWRIRHALPELAIGAFGVHIWRTRAFGAFDTKCAFGALAHLFRRPALPHSESLSGSGLIPPSGMTAQLPSEARHPATSDKHGVPARRANFLHLPVFRSGYITPATWHQSSYIL